MFQVVWGIIGHCGVVGVGDIKIAVACCSINSFVEILVLMMLPAVRDSINFKIAFSLLPGALGMVFVGSYVLVSLESLTLVRVLGMLLVATSTAQFSLYVWKLKGLEGKPFECILPRRSNKLPTEKEVSAPVPVSNELNCRNNCGKVWQHWKTPLFWGCFFTGCASGFLNGAFKSGGPPMMIFFAFLGLDKASIRSTSNLYSLMLTPLGISSSIVFSIWHAYDWQLYLVAPLSSVIGIAIGNAVHNKISTDILLTVLRIFVLLGSIPLTGLGENSVYGYMIAGVYAILLVAFIGVPLYVEYQLKQQIENEALGKDEHETNKLLADEKDEMEKDMDKDTDALV